MADEENQWDVTRTGLLIGSIGILLGVWTVWMSASPGIVLKPDLTYDFIIVGGGTAGCVLASRLSENRNYKVLLIEAGGEEPWSSSIPLAAPLLQKSKYDWQYHTLPQKDSMKALNKRESFWPRGKVLGGTGQINFNIHTFGSPQDYDLWENEYGARGWGFESIIKYANKAECLRLRPKLFKVQDHCSTQSKENEKCGSVNRDSDHRRKKQDAVQCFEPQLRKTNADSKLSRAFIQAGKELGLPVGNLNEDIDYGFMAADTTIYKGKRWSTARGYLRPVLGQRKNLHVVTNTHVTKIVWDGNRAVGVEYFQWDNLRMNGTAFARGEIILSAGAINTPLILVHSGIGPKATLKKLEISSPVSVLEGVGQNLQDHLNLPLYVSIQSPVSLNIAKLRSFSAVWNYFMYGKGNLARSAIEGVATAPVNGESPEVGMILFNMGAVDKTLYADVANIKHELFDMMFPGMHNDSSEGFVLLSSCLHPRSRGKLIFTNMDPTSSPHIQPNYLQHPYDLPCMRDAFRLAVRITKTTAFEALGASLQMPSFNSCNIKDEQGSKLSRTEYQEYLSCIIRTASLTGYHPLGTARMGRPEDDMAVVNSLLKVRNVERLRIADASVMPTQISGAPNSAVIVIAEKASDLIKEEWGDGRSLMNQRICSTSSDCEENIFRKLKNNTNKTPSPQLQPLEYFFLSLMLFLVK